MNCCVNQTVKIRFNNMNFSTVDNVDDSLVYLNAYHFVTDARQNGSSRQSDVPETNDRNFQLR